MHADPHHSAVSRVPVFHRSALASCVAIALSMVAAPSLASEEGTAFRLPRIDVVGKTDEDVARQPGAVSIVTEEELKLLQPMSTEDALRRVPGVHIKREEESAVVANIGIRGLSAGDYKSLILEDGVPVAPGLFVGNGRYYNPRIQRMESIEVLKGPAALRYGPNTVGGVINYRTRTPEDGFSISGRVGSYSLRETTIEAGGSAPSGEAQLGAIVTLADSDGFMDKGYKMSDVMIKGGMAIGDDQWLGVKFGYYDNDANISYKGLFVDAFKAGADYNPAPDDWFLTERKSFDINHEWQISDAMRLNTLVYWSDMYRDYWRFNVNQAASVAAGRWVFTDTVVGNNRSFERVGVETRLRVDHEALGMRNETEVGLRYMDESMNNKRVNATRAQPRSGTVASDVDELARSFALFAENRFLVNDRLAITPGLRVETYEQETDNLRNDANDGDTSNTEVLPGLGATWWFSPEVQFYGGVYKAFGPALNADAILGGDDQKLDAETSLNLEAGVRANHGPLRYEFTYFRMDFDNQIIPSVSGGLLRANGGETLHQGLEASVGFDFGKGFSVDANATYIPTSEFRYGQFKGNRVTYSPELTANISLGYEAGKLRTALLANYVSEQYTDQANTVPITIGTGLWSGRIPSYHTFDLNAVYELTPKFSMFGSIKNLSDERYIASLREGIYVGPERSFEVGGRYRF